RWREVHRPPARPRHRRLLTRCPPQKPPTNRLADVPRYSPRRGLPHSGPCRRVIPIALAKCWFKNARPTNPQSPQTPTSEPLEKIMSRLFAVLKMALMSLFVASSLQVHAADDDII